MLQNLRELRNMHFQLVILSLSRAVCLRLHQQSQKWTIPDFASQPTQTAPTTRSFATATRNVLSRAYRCSPISQSLSTSRVRGQTTGIGKIQKWFKYHSVLSFLKSIAGCPRQALEITLEQPHPPSGQKGRDQSPLPVPTLCHTLSKVMVWKLHLSLGSGGMQSSWLFRRGNPLIVLISTAE